MKKIFFGFMGLVLTLAVTVTSAYALFSDTVQLNNVAIGAGSADLEFSVDNSTWSDDYTFASPLLTNVVPGSEETSTFYVRNTGDSDVSLDLSARLVSASGDWGSFANVAKVTINGVEYTLADWNANVRDLGITLPPSDTGTPVEITLVIPEDAGNEISGKSVSTTWQLYGEQSTATPSPTPTATPVPSPSVSPEPSVTP